MTKARAWRGTVAGIVVGAGLGVLVMLLVLVPIARDQALCRSVNDNRDTLREVLTIIRDADGQVSPSERALGAIILPKLRHEDC